MEEEEEAKDGWRTGVARGRSKLAGLPYRDKFLDPRLMHDLIFRMMINVLFGFVLLVISILTMEDTTDQLLYAILILIRRLVHNAVIVCLLLNLLKAQLV